jgi:hypothetical protein
MRNGPFRAYLRRYVGADVAQIKTIDGGDEFSNFISRAGTGFLCTATPGSRAVITTS